MTLVIHVTRQQVAMIATTVCKFHINPRNGTRTMISIPWLEVMWKYAKVHEFRELYQGSRYITHPHIIKRNHS